MKPEMAISDITANVKYPVVILSSKAGQGNLAVAEAIADTLDTNRGVRHYAIEDLIPPELQRKHFQRYRSICRNFPWLLYIIYYIPVSYFWNYLEEAIFKKNNLTALKTKISSPEAKTIICTNHRACFWISALKARGAITASVWAVLADYYVNSGWKFLFWKNIDMFLGPAQRQSLPLSVRSKYTRIELPLTKGFYGMSPGRSSVDNVLIAGGGWGLGPIYRTVILLSERFPLLNIYVACGTNEALSNRLKRACASKKNVCICPKTESIYPFMELCASVISKPGAVLITEAFKSNKKIFLIKGLPVTEQKNALYAMKNFNACYFSVKRFSRWYYGNKKNDR